MANKLIDARECCVCKKAYKYCLVCSQYKHLPRWMNAYCSENCHDLYNITAGWVNGWLDKEVEIARLEKSDLSRLEYFPEWMQKVIKEMKEYDPGVSTEALSAVLDAEDKKEDVEVKEEKVDSEKSSDTTEHTESTESTEVKVESEPKQKNNSYKKMKPKYSK